MCISITTWTNTALSIFLMVRWKIISPLESCFLLCIHITLGWNEECCTRSRYQGQGQVITSHRLCGMLLLVPALDICLWHSSNRKHYYGRGLLHQSEHSKQHALYLIKITILATGVYSHNKAFWFWTRPITPSFIWTSLVESTLFLIKTTA